MNNQLVSRREKILKAGSMMFVAVAVASVIVAVSVVSIRFLWATKSYNDRVIETKTAARDQLNQNSQNLQKLADQYGALNDSESTNTRTILHALPPAYDYAALASSVESLAQRAGVSFTGAIGQDNSASAVASAPTSTPIEIPLTLQVSGDYGSIKAFIENLEKSIRPISVVGVTYSGTNSSLRASIQATTYYQPARSLEPTRSTVQ